MKRAAVLGALALAGALLISLFSGALSYEERLIRTSLANVLGPGSRELLSEIPELQALLLDYSETPELIFKARIAISKYGDDARSILTSYGAEPEFRQILANYGEQVIPVIQYFVENDPLSSRMIRVTIQAGGSAAKKAKELLAKAGGRAANDEDKRVSPDDETYGPSARGWDALRQIQEQGHDFLGQFVIGSDKKARWIQTERFLEVITSFFSSGIKNVETKIALSQEIKKADLFWAGVDATLAVSMVKALRAVKLARAGKSVAAAKTVGTSGRQLSFFNRTKLFTYRMVPKNAFGRMLLKGGAAAGLIYVIVKHPSVINGIFAELARTLGMNPFLVQFVGWTMVIFTLCWPLLVLLRVLLPWLIRAAGLLVWVLGRLERVVTPTVAKRLAASKVASHPGGFN